MTREQFLEQLRQALSGMKAEELEGVISYYDEMLDDRMEAGMTEEAAVNAMEPVQVIAARVLSEADVEAAAPEEGAAKESKEQEIRRPAGDIRRLCVTAENRRIVFRSEETEEILLRYSIEENTIFELHEDNGTLTLECRCRPVTSCFTSVQNGFSLDGLLDGIGKFINNIGNSIVGSDNAPIEVILPKVYWGAVEAESRNARITMEGITCSQGITLSTTNARVVLSDVVAREASVHTTNGRIELHDVYAREGMSAGGTNGQIIAENLNTDQKLRLATTNGRVTLDNVSGQDIDIRTSNGSVSGTVHGEREAFTIHSHTSNAGNNLMNREGGDRRLNIVTSNGAVNVSFTGTQEA